MQRIVRRPICWAALCGFLAACCMGCGGRPTGDYRRYVPTESAARQALEAALAAWQRGEPPGRLGSVSPAVEVKDTKRQEGQKLARYEILKVEPTEGPRWFSVKLTLENPSSELEVRYAVLGQDPILIFREDDFAQAASM